MGILEILADERASFICLHDTVVAIATTGKCSYRDAARGLQRSINKVSLRDIPDVYKYCYDTVEKTAHNLGDDESADVLFDFHDFLDCAINGESMCSERAAESILLTRFDKERFCHILFEYGFEKEAIRAFLQKFGIAIDVENHCCNINRPKELPMPWIEPPRSPYITMMLGVELISNRRGVSLRDAAKQLIGMLNDAAYAGRPVLFERDGAARKKVPVPDERYVTVIQSLDILMKGRPRDDWNDPGADAVRAVRRSIMKRAGAHGWNETEFTLYPGRIAVLDQVEVRIAEFEEFAALMPPQPAVVVTDTVVTLASPAPGGVVRPKGVTKKEMVKRHSARWPTIKTDMSDASTSELKSAKAGARGWIEDAALRWAKENHRYHSEPEPGTLDAVMANGFTPRRHKLHG